MQPTTGYVWLNANSRRAEARLPASAVCYTEWLPNGRGLMPSRYVYRVPAGDVHAGLFGHSYRGKITRARVVEANAMRCWSGEARS